MALNIFTRRTASPIPTSQPKPGSRLMAPTLSPIFPRNIVQSLSTLQVIRRFHDEVVTPLSTRNDTEAIFQFFHNVLSAQQLTINWTIVMPRHRTAHPSEPPEDDLVKVLPRTSYPTLPCWIDNLVTKINHLVQLLTNADDLPRSAHGWVFLRALRKYDGPAVPGNQDPQTNQIVYSHTFSLTSRNSAIDFTEKILGGMAAYDRRKRLTLGEARDHNNKASIVVALTSQLPKRILTSIHQPVLLLPHHHIRAHPPRRNSTGSTLFQGYRPPPHRNQTSGLKGRYHVQRSPNLTP